MNYSRLIDPAAELPVHFVGIAGAGMSGLAELFARQGVKVSGCDNNVASATADLGALGIQLFAGHDAAHVRDARAVVYTSAMPLDHPELVAARAAGIPVVRRAEALGAAVSGGDVVGVAGTHGKTTTTVMTTEALRSASRLATGIAGGRVAAWGGNLSFGSDELFVVEADEYDRSFLALAPTVAVVTNVEADHLDIYRDLEDIRETFSRYVARARVIVLCADDEGAASIDLPNTAEIIRYGLESPDARLVASGVIAEGRSTRFDVAYDGKRLGEFRIGVPGLHNVRNALAALGSVLGLGADPLAAREGLAGFAGVERRFQLVCDTGGVVVIDDYAHHPTEIEATIAAARGAYPGRRIVVAFQPHLYSRTRDFAAAFGSALARADVLYITELYPAREQPLEGVTSALVENAARAAGRAPAWGGARSELAAALAEDARDGDVILTVGAGDITRTAGELGALLGARDH